MIPEGLPMIRTTPGSARSAISTSVRATDPLAQFGVAPFGPPIEFAAAARTFWAFALLAAGTSSGAWLVLLIHAVVFHPQTVGLLDRLAPSKPDGLTMNIPSCAIRFPAEWMSVLG